MTASLRELRVDRPEAHASLADLRKVRELVPTYELALRPLAEELSLPPAAAALLALLAMLPRPDGAPLGVGLCLPRRALAARLGVSLRTLDYAISALLARRLITRTARFEPLRWVDSTGKQRVRAQTCSLLLPTPEALDRLRELPRAPLWAALWRRTRIAMRRLARRVAASWRRCTPKEEKAKQRELHFEVAKPRLWETFVSPALARCAGVAVAARAAFAFAFARALDAKPPDGSGGRGGRVHRAAVDAWNAEVDRCWRDKTLTPATAYPHLWARSTRERRDALEVQFAPMRRVLTARLMRQAGAS